MRRAVLAAVVLGVVGGLLFVFHDSLELSASWPVILGFALWTHLGERGSRGAMVGLAAAIGVGVAYGTFALVANYLPITNLTLGITVGLAVGLLVLLGLGLRDRLPMTALLIGYAAMLGVFEPLWLESPANVRSHGIESLTVTLLGLLLGILVATIVRVLGDRMSPERAEDETKDEASTRARAPAEPMKGRA